MRKGAGCRPWSTADERWLADNAGRVPRAELCRHLRRSASSVYSKAHELRGRGWDVGLRCWEPAGGTCPACGRVRAAIRDDGICQLCWERRALERCQAETAALLALLPPDERELYAGTEGELESRVDPAPPPPNLPESAGWARRARARDGWLDACEAVEVANAHRRLKAARKRRDRIAAKVEVPWNGGTDAKRQEEEA